MPTIKWLSVIGTKLLLLGFTLLYGFAQASDVIEYSYIERDKLLTVQLPEAALPLINAIDKCEAERGEWDWSSCGHIYLSENYELIVELCRPAGDYKVGLHIASVEYDSWYYPWVNRPLMEFSCNERDSFGQDTSYYGVEPDSSTGFKAMLYRYSINLSFGHIYFLLLPDSKTQVLDDYSDAMAS